MTRYELMYLVPTKYAEDELGGVIGQVRDLVIKHGGKVTFEDSLGKKRLAYPIKGATTCYYLLSHFDAEAGTVRALDQDLRLHNDVVRHLLVKRSEVTRKAAPAPAAPTAAATEESKQEDRQQAKLADLDRKLDELLTKDII
ncbi:MAG: 30S ribosomal protein S6 [bacterium]|nr:30S ribosomal protein S6 [bacterium]